MGRFLILISFLTATLNVFSQDKQFKVDTFYSSNNFVSSYLLISSDTTFFVAFNNCTDANIARGKWKKSNGKLYLIPESGANLYIKPNIDNKITSQDTTITFQVLDYFKNPIENYTVIFFDKDLKQYDYFTDDKGVLKVPKEKFVAYLTVHEFNNMDIGSDLTTIIHFLWNKYSDITLTLNYPKEILRQRPNAFSFPYDGDEFIKTSKGLTSPKSRLTLTKL